MKKCELFPVFDDQAEQIKNVQALANIVRIGIGGETIADKHLKQCATLLCDIAETVGENHDTGSQVLAELYIVYDAVNGDSD